jgi:hypothetical protein
MVRVGILLEKTGKRKGRKKKVGDGRWRRRREKREVAPQVLGRVE